MGRDGFTDILPGKIATIVTSLEMVAKPSLHPDPPAVPWTVDRASRPTLDWYRGLYRRVGQEWLWFSRLALSDDALEAIVHDPDVAVYALRLDGADRGLLELDFRGGRVCELSFLGVTRELMGKGAGRWLLNRAVEIAWSKSIDRLWVHTCTLDHPRALSLYIGAGFRPFRRQVEIADDPRLTGLLPSAVAPHVPIIRG